MVELSAGEILRFHQASGNMTVTTPYVIQVISPIQLLRNQASDAHRCMVSDGERMSLAVIPNKLSSKVADETITRFTILKVNKCSVSKKERPNETPMLFIVIHDAEILGTVGERIGNPAKLSEQDDVGAGFGAPQSFATGPAVAESPISRPAYQQQQPPPPQQQQPQQQSRFGGAQSSFMNRVDDIKPKYSGMGGSAPVHTGAPPSVHPISDLNPYHNKWTIRARVTQKTSIKSWNKPTSQGRLFSVNLLDDSGEIRATTFTQQVDKLFPLLETGKVYYISNAQVRMAKQQFSNVNNQYELTFDDNTIVELCLEQANVPQEHYDFIPLSSLEKFEKNQVVDVLCVLKDAGDVSEITSRTDDRKMVKRELTIVDKSGFQVRASLWGTEAETFNVPVEHVIAFKGMRVGDFGGRTLSLPSVGSMTVNPDIPDAHTLRGWYDAEGRHMSFQSFRGTGGGGAGRSGGGIGSAENFESQLKTMAQVGAENIGTTDATEFFNLKGTIAFIRSNNLAYPSCPGENCSKKVTEGLSSGQWRCEKCERSWPAPDYRYIFSFNVSDDTGQNWLQCFNEVGEVLLGATANEMIELQRVNEVAFGQKLADATFKEYKFRCKARSETFNEVSRVRISATNAYPIDYVAETARLSRLIDSYN
ncbi:Replication factor A protein 1 [Coemansia pectinata]|uniref:Replication protein A subunit n=1 Tax=Coemansia pectinata TaxID=1052879 RepID=A0A9W8H024_9FUNG|nr:Replication factor A protein 1 [Coemansia pectinata]